MLRSPRLQYPSIRQLRPVNKARLSVPQFATHSPILPLHRPPILLAEYTRFTNHYDGLAGEKGCLPYALLSQGFSPVQNVKSQRMPGIPAILDPVTTMGCILHEMPPEDLFYSSLLLLPTFLGGRPNNMGGCRQNNTSPLQHATAPFPPFSRVARSTYPAPLVVI